jgi:CubicO group peptidase (beta-lactamase class C family)
MKNYIIILLLVFVYPLNGQISSSEQAKIDTLFAAWNKPSMPGAALGIVKDGKLIYTHGYGMADLEHNVPIADTTVFYAGSVSKQFVAMCVLLLEEQGKLSLDDEVRKYLPEFPDYGFPITIRHFLNHTSGVRDNLTLWYLAGRDELDGIDKMEMYRLICDQKELNFKPGEQFMYSNSCYFMLGLIIEKVSGEPLKDFARKNIFEPLGMRSTFFQDDNTRIIKNRAFSYTEENGMIKNQIMRYNLVGSGGLYTTVKDMYLWDQNFYHNKLGKGTTALIEKMHVEGTFNNGRPIGIGYALGLQNGNYRGLKTVSHGGALAGYRSFFLRFPEQSFSVVILGNMGTMDVTGLSYAIANIFLEKKLAPLPTINQDKIPNSQQNNLVPYAAKAPDQYEGIYYCGELEAKYQFYIMNKFLWCSINGRKPFFLEAVEMDKFIMDGSESITFVRNDKNDIIGFDLKDDRITKLSFTKIK